MLAPRRGTTPNTAHAPRAAALAATTLAATLAATTLVAAPLRAAATPSALTTPVATPTEDEDADAARAERIRMFEEMLTGATLEGCFTTGAVGDDGLPKLHKDRYTLQSVRHLSGDLFLFTTRIQYGDKDVSLPLPLKVVWAGDTPVITLTDFAVPPLGTFTARVLFYRGEYAGNWDGGDHGGQMFGKVLPKEPEAAEGDFVVAPDPNWPQFRGPRALGVAEGHALPVEWDVEDGTGVKWSADIPGLAHSSPIVFGDRVFVTTAVKDGDGDDPLKVGLYGDIGSVEDETPHSMRVLCLDKDTGAVLWDREAFHGVPKVKRHPKSSHAACSPATDGERVIAHFASEGLYAYDMDGNLLWQKDLGVLDSGFYMVPSAQWGSASSPVLHDGKVVLLCDVQQDSFLAVFDADTGEEIWRTERLDVPTWGTPAIFEKDGRTQIVCNGFKETAGYDFETGEQIWWLEGGGDIPVPTPIVAHDLIYVTNAHGTLAPIYAIKTTARGELTMDPDECVFMAWCHPRRGNYMQTPVVYGDLAYFCNDAGILSCYDARTGEEVYRQRLGSGRSGFSASAVAGDDKLYFTSEDGLCYVVKAGEEFELLSYNDLVETAMATPAISEGVIFFRTRSKLVAVDGVGAGE